MDSLTSTGSWGAYSPSTMHGESPPGRLRINIWWLIRLRWAAVLGQGVTILGVRYGMRIELPMLPLFSVLSIVVISNGLLEWWFRKEKGAFDESAELVHGLVLFADVLLLGLVLYFTGGPANPFGAFYLVHVTQAAVVLEARWAWRLTAVGGLSLIILSFKHWPLPALEPMQPLQYQGTVVALVATMAITAFFVTRVTITLARREEELHVERERKARNERLEGLATLATGAAHELATPLSTIAVVAKELERHLENVGADEESAEDARLIRTEVARCRHILDRMRIDSGSSAGEEIVDVPVGELMSEAVDELGDSGRVDVRIASEAAEEQLFVPRQGLAMALRGILQNALDASAPDGRVIFEALGAGQELLLLTRDEGEGMPPEIMNRALDPFFTTKGPGGGMGLGLFLARSTVERLGGRITIDSKPGRGSRVSVYLPLVHVRRQAT